MAGIKSLADGKMKIAVLTSKPVNPAAPTTTELNAGVGGAVGAACNIALADWQFGAADSDKVADPAICDNSNANALGRANFVAGMTVFRYFDPTTKAADATADALFAAVNVRGTELWIYMRQTAKDYSEPWASGDEVSGEHVITDAWQYADSGGYIKRKVPMEAQAGWPNAVVAAGA